MQFSFNEICPFCAFSEWGLGLIMYRSNLSIQRLCISGTTRFGQCVPVRFENCYPYASTTALQRAPPHTPRDISAVCMQQWEAIPGASRRAVCCRQRQQCVSVMRLRELLVAFSGVQCWISLFLVSLFLPKVVKTVPVPCEHGTTGTRVSERSDTLFQFVLVTVQLLPVLFENCSVLLYHIDPSQLTSWQSRETSACLLWTQCRVSKSLVNIL